LQKITQYNYYDITKLNWYNSPSSAASQVLARNANGWIERKDKQGKTLDELKRK